VASRSAVEVPPAAERAEIWSLLEGWKLDAADRRITPLIARHPDADWPHLARAELYFRRLWRRNAVLEWERALERDPRFRQDPSLGAHLCQMLDAKWEAAGIHRLLGRLGPQAARLLDRCVSSAPNPQQRALAERALARLNSSR
jgi:predicted Zn-dependent protease